METEVPVSATALVVKNSAQRLLANFYYKINRPQKPLEIFKTIDSAINWLKENH